MYSTYTVHLHYMYLTSSSQWALYRVLYRDCWRLQQPGSLWLVNNSGSHYGDWCTWWLLCPGGLWLVCHNGWCASAPAVLQVAEPNDK